MIRIDRSRLEKAAFPVRISVATRFDDLDMQGHINNVAFASLIQEANILFNRAHVYPQCPPGTMIFVGGLCIDYVGQMHYPEPVEISTGVLEISRSTYVFGHRLEQGGRVTGYSEVNLILGTKEGSIPIPDAARAALEAVMIQPA
jgi:acyl-CoA thioester hydrolase